MYFEGLRIIADDAPGYQCRVYFPGGRTNTLSSPYLTLVAHGEVAFREFLRQQMQYMRCALVFGQPDLNYGDETTNGAWSTVIRKMYRPSEGLHHINDQDFVLVELEKLKRLAVSGKLFLDLRANLRARHDAEPVLANIGKHEENLRFLSDYVDRKQIWTTEIFQQLLQTLAHSLYNNTTIDTSYTDGKRVLMAITEERILFRIMSGITFDSEHVNLHMVLSSQEELNNLMEQLNDAIENYQDHGDAIVRRQRVGELKRVRNRVRALLNPTVE
jgi:hypothetical protein